MFVGVLDRPLSHHPQEVLLAEFSLYVHKSVLKPDSFHFIFFWIGLFSLSVRGLDRRITLVVYLFQNGGDNEAF